MKTDKYYTEKVAFYYSTLRGYIDNVEYIGHIKNPKSRGNSVKILEKDVSLTKVLIRNEDFELYQHPYHPYSLLVTHPDLPKIKFAVQFDQWELHRSIYGLDVIGGKYEGKFRFYSHGSKLQPSLIVDEDIEEKELTQKGLYMNMGQVSKFKPGNLYFNKSDRQYYLHLGLLKHNGLESVWGDYESIRPIIFFHRSHLVEFKNFVGASDIFLNFCFRYNYSCFNFEQLFKMAILNSNYLRDGDEINISVLKSSHYFVDLGHFIDIKEGWKDKLREISYIDIDINDVSVKEELINSSINSYRSGYITNHDWELYKKQYETSIESLINIYGPDIKEEIKKIYELKLRQH